ncbi:MAG TPA: hypothetical protein VK629_04755 [Steroidobacteraceae bacterium]|nr:hypothetical protein [Steroidobacteraceae bacterium]
MTIRTALMGLALIAAAGLTTPASAQSCDAKCLHGHLDAYMAALPAHSAARLPVAANVKYTENGKALMLGKGLWEKASGLTPYAHSFVDAVSQQAMFYGIVKEGAESTIASIRLGIANGKIAEVEHIVARKGSHALFAPQVLTQPNPMLTTAVVAAKRSTRIELIAIADSYMEGIQQHSSKIVRAAIDCQRIENGVQTTNQPGRGSKNCQHSADLLTYIKSVDERRFPIVDVERGIVFSTFIFDIPGEVSSANDASISSNAQLAATLREPRMLLLTEWFKIEGGVITHIEAAMHNLPHGTRSGWGGSR